MKISNIQKDLKGLQYTINKTESYLSDLKKELMVLENIFDEWTFKSLLEATDTIPSCILHVANEDCEGIHNCGKSEYHVFFKVKNRNYRGVMEIKYDRHNKIYYYIMEYSFKYTKIKNSTSIGFLTNMSEIEEDENLRWTTVFADREY